MSLSKFQNINNIEATKIFTNRDTPMKIFDDNFENYLKSKDEYFKVLIYYGVGGIGKTTLLNQFINKIKDNNKRNNFLELSFISLDTYEFDSPIDILVSIRNSLNINCTLFDLAILSYWEKSGISSKMLTDNKKLKDNSIIWDVIDIASPISSSLLKRAYDFINTNQKKYFSKFKTEIEEINNLLPTELEERLPYYLGLCIKYEYKKSNKSPIFIFDAYETMFRKFSDKSIKLDADFWIREFIASIEFGLFIIAGREYIKWSLLNPEWEQFLEQHILGQLSDEDAKFFLKNIPIRDESIINAIVKVSNGVPLYLDLCVNIYLRKKNAKLNISKSDFVFPRKEVVSRFLRHLEKEEQEILKVLSYVNFFDFKLFRFLNAEFQIGYPVSLFFENITVSIIEELDKELALYKIHDYVRDQLKNSLPIELKIEIIKKYLHHFSIQKENYDPIIIKKYIGNILSAIDIKINIDTNDVENILSICFYLIDKGYWLDLKKGLLQFENIIIRKNPELKNAFLLINGIIIRRTGKIRKAIDLLKKGNPEKEELGKYYESYIFHQANFQRLIGNYAFAKQIYNQLLPNSSDIKNKLSLSIRNQYSDILFLEGRFNESLQLLKTVSDNININEYKEINRTKGHIYRFNFMFEESYNIYKKLYHLAKKNVNIGFKGKLLTNLTELNCWFYPDKAITYGTESIEINTSINAIIELGKTTSSMAIAYLLKNDVKNAKKYVNESKTYQNESGYKSGLLFAEIANYFIAYKENNALDKEHNKNKIKDLIDELKVYRFLYLPIAMAESETNFIENSKRTTEWIDFKYIYNFYNDFILKLNNNSAHNSVYKSLGNK